MILGFLKVSSPRDTCRGESRPMRIIFAALFLLLILIKPVFCLNFQTGSIHNSVGGSIEGLGIAPLHNDSQRENPTAVFKVQTKSTFSDLGDLKINLRGEYDGTVLYPHDHEVFLDYTDIYQDRNPFLSADEAYLDLYTAKADFRLGIQKFAWGRLDELSPVDILNTDSMTNPFIEDDNSRKIGGPSAKANIYSDFVNLELDWIPRWVPYRLPMSDERWFPTVLIVPESIYIAGYGPPFPANITVPVNAEYKDIDMPACTFENSEIGAKISKTIGKWDVSAMYFRGYDTMPVFDIPVQLSIQIDQKTLRPSLSLDIELEPRVFTIEMYAVDFTTTTGNFTLRGDAAFFRDRRYIREIEGIINDYFTQDMLQSMIKEVLKDPFNPHTFTLNPPVIEKKNSAKYGLGFDYIKGDTTVTGQIIQEYIFDYDDKLLFNKNGIDTMFTLSLRHMLFNGRFEAALYGSYGIEYRQFLIKPSISYDITDNLRATLAGLVFGGEKDSLLGQYSNNDEIFLKVKYSY
jgi:hypothetical protein